MADIYYNSFLAKIQDGSIDLDTDTIKVMLVTGHTPDRDAHEFRDDVEADEISGAGYTAGGATLASKVVSKNNTTDSGDFDFTDVEWSSSTLSATGAIFYKARGGASSADELICFRDFGGTKVSENGTFTLQVDAAGFHRIAQATP